jgi:galactokinase
MPERKHDEIMASRFAKKFSARFAVAPQRIFRAPGRANLIGEHADYNDGFVLPAAIELRTWTAIAPRKDHQLHVFSENLNETAELDLTETHPQPQHRWPDYVHGVALMLQKLAVPLAGANIFIASEIPRGAGLSSSAALEVSVASALLSISGATLDLVEIAKLCQQAENEFVGARVGIMDQFASCFGSADHAILLDCRTLECQRLQLPASLAMVVCNTMVKHEHAGGEYNKRRAQCQEGVTLLRRTLPSIKALRDVTLAQLQAHRDELPELIYGRCHHVISETERVLRCATALQAGDFATVGRCMAESHFSLKDDYQVSCRELDVMVEIAARRDGVVGSRMTGGGFGGSTINLVKTDAVEEFKHHVSREYKLATQIAPDIYVSKAGQGVTEVDVSTS